MDLLTPINFEDPELKPANLDDLLLALQKEHKDSNSHSAYNGETSIQFHFFLLALFVAYLKVLKERDAIQVEQRSMRKSSRQS